MKRSFVFQKCFNAFVLLAAAAVVAQLQTNSARAQWLEINAFSPSTPSAFQLFGSSTAIHGYVIGGGYQFAPGASLFEPTTGNEFSGLTPGGGVVGGYGYSVAIDNNWAIVGSPSGGPGAMGAAHVFNSASGAEVTTLLPSDGYSDNFFGTSVGVSGSYAVVGSPQIDNGAGFLSGAVYLYNPATGQELNKLVPSDAGAGDTFGRSVAVSGNRVLVGADGNSAAYLFDATTGQELLKLTPTVSAPGFGNAVAIEDNWLLVGAANRFGSGPGKAFLFDITTGEQLLEFVPSDSQNRDLFGMSVAMHEGIVVIGAPFNDAEAGAPFNNQTGSAYVFDRATGTQLTKLVGEFSGLGDEFGWSVGTRNGTVVVGSPRNDDSGTDAGVIYMFQNLVAVWSPEEGNIWNDFESWESHVVPNAPDARVLFGTSILENSTITVNIPVTAEQITFDNPNYSYTVAGSQTFPLTLTGDAEIIVASGTHTIRGLAGTNGFVKAGEGTLILDTANYYSGVTVVNQGTLELAAAQALRNSEVVVINPGSTINAPGDAYFGYDSGSDVSVLLSGSTGVNATLSVTNNLYVGYQGTVYLETLNYGPAGGDIIADQLFVGSLPGGDGYISIGGNPSSLHATNGITLGGAGEGTLVVTSGATVTTDGDVRLATVSTGYGELTISGSTALMEVGGSIRVGEAGQGYVNVHDGGTLHSSGAALAPEGASGAAYVLITGNNSSWTIDGNLDASFANDTTSLIRVADGGTLSVGGGSGMINLTDSIFSTGELQIGSGSFYPAAGNVEAFAVNGGGGNAVVNFGHNTSNYIFSPRLLGNVRVNHTGSGTTILDNDNTYTGTTEISAGTLIINGSHHGGGDYTVGEAGTLGGIGSISANVSNAGRVAPGNSPGILVIDGNYTQTSTGTLEIEVGGLTPGTQHDQLQVSGNVALDGRLDVPIINGFTPVVGQTVNFLLYNGSISGSFNSITSPGLIAAAPGVAIRVNSIPFGRQIEFIATSNNNDFVSTNPGSIWSNTASWLTNTIPTTADVIDLENQATVAQELRVLNANAFTHKLSVTGNANPLTVSIENGHTLSATTSTTIGANGVVALDTGSLASAQVNVQAGGQLVGNGNVFGTLTIGTTTGAQKALLSPGFSIGAVTVQGEYIQTDSGEMRIEIEGDDSDTVTVTGAATLGGVLTVALQEKHNVQAGDQFEFLTASTLGDTEFDRVVTQNGEGIYLAPEYTLESAALYAYEIGDMNRDLSIDTRDIAVFALALKNPAEYSLEYGISGAGSGDADWNGILDFDDIDDFAKLLPAGSLARIVTAIENYGTVPEPTMAVLCLLLAGLSPVIRVGQRPAGRASRTNVCPNLSRFCGTR